MNNQNVTKPKTDFSKMIKKIIIIIVVFALVATGVGIGVNYYLNRPKDPKPIIEEMAKKYYETVLYTEKSKAYKDDDLEKNLEQLGKVGIEKTLFDINRFVDHKDKHLLLNSSVSGIKCDFYKTKAKYYPKSPYQATDYKMELTVECKNLK